MGIEKLRGSLLADATKEADRIVQSAEGRAKSLLEEEHSKDTAVKAEAEREVARLLEEQRNERAAWARLEAKRTMAEAKEDAIKNAMEDFFDALAKVRKSPDYRAFLTKAVQSASAELGGDVTVHVCAGDKALLSKCKAKIVEDLEGLGGTIVESADGKVRVNLTIETLVEAKKDELRKQIYDKLFGEKVSHRREEAGSEGSSKRLTLSGGK